MTKRQQTDYVVLMDKGTAGSSLTPVLAKVGEVRAYTPQQARRRAAHLGAVQSEAAQRKAAVTVYAVPQRNMNPGQVESFTGTRLREVGDE